MTNWKTSATYGLNKFIWYVFQDQLEWTTITTPAGTFRPIIPIQEEPELSQAKKPYMVYRYATVPQGTNWFLTQEQCTYAIYSDDPEQIRSAVNLLTSMFKRFDESAQQLNDWLKANGSEDNKDYDYKWIKITNASAPEETETEGGRQGGLVVIQYEYSHDSDDKPLSFA